MDRDFKIPENLKSLLENCDITGKDILYVSRADIDDEYRFADGYVILSKDYMALASYKPAKIIYGMGGYHGTGVEMSAKNHDAKPDLEIISLNDVESLEVIREITGGALIGKINKTERLLCRFTNSNMGGMERLAGNLEKIRIGEELSDEDIYGTDRIEHCPKCGSLYPDRERKVCPKCMDKRSIFMRILAYFMKYRAKIALMAICYIFMAALNLAWPYLSGSVLYDKILGKNDEFMKFLGFPAGQYVLALAIVVAVMIISKTLMQVCGIIQGVMTAGIVPGVMSELKQEIFKSMGRLSISFYNSRQTGGLMTRALDDAGEIAGFFIDGLPYFVSNIIVIISTAAIMFSLNPLLAASSLFLLPFLTVISYKMLPGLWSLYGKRHRAARRLNGQMNDNITGARVVKAFGRENQETDRFRGNNEKLRKAELDITDFDNKFYALYNAVQNISVVIVWCAGSYIVLQGDMKYGELITFTAYVAQLGGPLEFMSFIFRWWTNSMNAAQRIFEIIDAMPDVAEKENPIRPERIEGNIELRNVTFGYEPHKPVLKDVSFNIEAGKMLGIVGRSGAGKSTLVNLISRLYDAESGEIYIDGINVRDMGFKELRRSVAMVSQETYIFMGSVAENIAYARPEATRKEIVEAAILASAHDFICKMPDGYDTVIGRGGRDLSGGEKQRISIARAILSNPRILILDEATAAVDTETELAIQESLERLVEGRTTLSIAHRLSTLKNADKLIVIDDGKIAEEGTHAELTDKKGIYFKLMELQTKALAMRGLE